MYLHVIYAEHGTTFASANLCRILCVYNLFLEPTQPSVSGE